MMPDDMRWAAVGHAHGTDAIQAAEQAVGDAVAGREAALVVLFASMPLDLAAAVRRAHEVAGGAPLVGCSTSGEFSHRGPGVGGVVALALGGEGFTVATRAADALADGPRAAGAAVAGALDDVEAPHRMLMLLTEGLRVDAEEVVRGAHSVAGAPVPLVGGCAGGTIDASSADWSTPPPTYLFHDGETMQDAVVAAAIGSDAPLGIGVEHGWRPRGGAMLVTGTEGDRILTLDGRPALDVYLELFGVSPESLADPAAFSWFAMTHPLSLARSTRTDGAPVRWIGGADFEERSLITGGATQIGAVVQLLEGDRDTVLGAADAACADAIAALGGADPTAMLVFDCLGRRFVLGEDGSAEEVGRIARQAGDAPVAGFYTLGEVARRRGPTGYHIQTCVALAIA